MNPNGFNRHWLFSLCCAAMPFGTYWLQAYLFVSGSVSGTLIYFFLFLFPTAIGLGGAVGLVIGLARRWPATRFVASPVAIAYPILLFWTRHVFEIQQLAAKFPQEFAGVSFLESFAVRCQIDIVHTRSGRRLTRGESLFEWIGPWSVEGMLFLLATVGLGYLCLARATPGQCTDRVPAQSKSLPARRRPSPLRSKFGGVSFICLGLFLFVGSLFASMTLSSSGVTAYEFIAQPVFLLGLALSGGALAVGRRIYRTDPARLLRTDPRAPVLYLRSFGEDELPSATLAHRAEARSPTMPGPGWAWLLALLAFISLSLIHPFVFLGAFMTFFLLVFLCYLFFKIVDIFWEICGRDCGSIEQEVATFFGRFGPFIAIGKPGEMFSPSGAARFYVDDHEWQTRVSDLIREAQITVLQIGVSEGTWWEFKTCRRLCEPERLLILFAGSVLEEPSWSFLRQQLAAADIFLPPEVGEFSFVSFDQNWIPQFHPVKFRPKLFWAFSDSVYDLQQTLHPYLRSRNRALNPM